MKSSESVLKAIFSGIGVLGILLVAAGLGIYLGMDRAPVHASVGAKAPQIRGTTATGGVVDTADLAGDVVVVNFWATWCGPCLRELPSKSELAREFEGQGVHVIGVSGDTDRQNLAHFEESNPTGFPTIFTGAQGIYSMWGVSAIPTVVVIGRDGRITYRGSGRGLREAVLAAK